MTDPIRRVGVIGAGVMGSGIAAHFANAGVEVVLLDIVPPESGANGASRSRSRSQFAEEGLKKALKAKPAPFFHKSRASLVRTGNLEDDFQRLAACDLIIEAIVENLDIKRKLFARFDTELEGTRIVASNTSGLRIASMVEGRSEAFRSRFLVMHFFNPVRYMKLLELVRGPETSDEVYRRVAEFGTSILGKGIVEGKDTPNFVGNRIGCHALMSTIHQMLADGLEPEDVDAITGSPMGHPKSASFRTADMVGIDTFVHVSENCHAALVDDEDREVFQIPDFMKHMVAKKLLGNKTKGGFYKKTKEGISTLDPSTLEYRPKAGDPEIKKFCKSLNGDARSRVKKLVEDNGPAGAFARKLLSKTLSYTARRMGEIAEDISAVDDAMRWGYNWELGPFETWDALGFRETAERMKKEGHSLPTWIDTMLGSDASAFYRGNEVWNPALGQYQVRKSDARNTTLTLLRGEKPPVLSNSGAVAHDIGDGVLAVTFKTKANSLDDSVIALMGQAIEEAEKNHRAMLLFNEGEHFCVGANLFALVMAANQKQWEGIRNTVQTLQKTMQRIKYASVPVVAAPYGMALGGGLEVCLCADAVQAAAETYCGLVEVGVGLIPGGAGNLNLLWRALETTPEGAEISPHPYITQVFKNIAMAKVATSAEEAKFFGYFRHSDGVSFDRDRQLSEAKARAIGMAESGYHPPSRRSYRLAGEDGVATLSMMVDTLVAGGYASPHDALIARKLAVVLSGGAGGAAREVTEDEILELEAEAFVSLCGEQKSIDRMQHMLMHNKPLRN